jgi:hypothetical protein
MMLLFQAEDTVWEVRGGEINLQSSTDDKLKGKE